jgi:predicted DNA-binding transcriptional regulator AlpA
MNSVAAEAMRKRGLSVNNPELLTAKQVGWLLSISKRTVFRMLERGELPPPIRVNRKLCRWHLPTLLRYLEEMAMVHTGY